MDHWQIYAGGIATAMVIIASVGKMANDCKKSIQIVYKRFDDYKEHLERTHVSKEVHNIQYAQIEKKMDEIAADVKTLIKKANGG